MAKKKMTKHERRQKKNEGSCKRKISYPTKNNAEYELELAVLRGSPRRSMRIYSCSICGGYHLTHHSGRWR